MATIIPHSPLRALYEALENGLDDSGVDVFARPCTDIWEARRLAASLRSIVRGWPFRVTVRQRGANVFAWRTAPAPKERALIRAIEQATRPAARIRRS